MNILPLICGLLMVFSFLTFTFLRDEKSLSIAEWSLTAAARTERGVNNKLEQRKFRRAQKAPQVQVKPAASKNEKKDTSQICLRKIDPPPGYAKLSLTPLFENLPDISNHPIYKTTARLIFLLYKNMAPVGQEAGWEKRILNEMIAKKKTLDVVDGLFDLTPKDPQLAAFYYKMLKGTNNYDVDRSIGIPPLGDFVTLDEEKKENTIYLSFAPSILLQALFGKQITQEILAMENKEWETKHHYHIIDKEQLQAILLQHHSTDINLSILEPYLNFLKKIPTKKSLAGKDKKTGITIKKKC